MMLVTGCQRTVLIELPEKLKEPCPKVKFVAGQLMPQVIKLRKDYIVCKAKLKAVVELLEHG